MGRYIARRLLNYVVLLFIAVSLTYFLAATQLNPRALYEVRNPPLDPPNASRSGKPCSVARVPKPPSPTQMRR